MAYENRSAWLDPSQGEESSLVALLRPFSAEPMSAFPVSRRVSNPAHDDLSCLEPAENALPG